MSTYSLTAVIKRFVYRPTFFISLFLLAAFSSVNAQAQEPLIRINAGTSEEATDEGETFIGDTFFSNQSTVGPAISRSIDETTNDELYQSERITDDDGNTFGYDIPVPDGMYSINLHFAETAFDQVGMRVFDVLIEGNLALEDYDILNEAGESNTARIESISGIQVTDGSLTIEFEAITERAKINGIEVFGTASEITVPFLLNVGGFEFVSTTETWMEDDDSYFLEGNELQISESITGTTADEIYQSERFGNDVDPLRFILPGVPEGVYSLELHFSENFFDDENSRVFNVYIEGSQVLEDFDIIAEAGGKFTAHVEPFPDIEVTDGILNITLEPLTASTTINAIAITTVSLVSNEEEQALPSDYALSAVYPNPFNPTTQFSLSIDHTQHVAIEVFNLLGQRVSTLHNGQLAAQTNHLFTFEASNQPSGLYLIRVTGERFNETRQVVLMK